MSAATGILRPYIGLRYFEERDANLYFGRDEHVTDPGAVGFLLPVADEDVVRLAPVDRAVDHATPPCDDRDRRSTTVARQTMLAESV